MPLPISIIPTPDWDTQAEAAPEDNIAWSDSDIYQAHQNEALAENPTAVLGRMSIRSDMANQPTINGTQAEQQYSFNGPTPELSIHYKPEDQVNPVVAQQQQDLMRQRASDQWIEAHGPSTFGAYGAAFAGDMVGQARDPLNIAATLLPPGWELDAARVGLETAGLARGAAEAAALSQRIANSTALRITAAGLNNATAVALTQPILLAGAQQDHSDYTFADAASNVLFGGLLGAGLHGAGEAIGSVLDASVARGMLRVGAEGLDNGAGVHPMLADDMVNMARPKVVQDLTDQLGREPTEDEITAEQSARGDAIIQNSHDGKYDQSVPGEETPVDVGAGDAMAVNDKVNSALQNEDYDTAASALKQHTMALENDPALSLSDEDKAVVNQPVEQINTTRSLLSDFVDCVGQEAS